MNFVKLERMPLVGEYVYQDYYHGLIKYEVLENNETYPRPTHPELVELRVVDNFDHSFFHVGQLCCRSWHELVKIGE